MAPATATHNASARSCSSGLWASSEATSAPARSTPTKEAVRGAGGRIHADPLAVIGAVSLILWALILIVSLTYAVLILRADNDGEGGIVAMPALLGTRHAKPRSRKALLLVVGLIGAALLYGDFLAGLQHQDLVRVRGTGAILSSATHGIPLHLSRFVERSRALPERVLIVSAQYEDTPTVPASKRGHVTILAPDFYRVTLCYGFLEDASIPDDLACAIDHRHLPGHGLDDLTVFIGHETIIPKNDDRGMAPWRESLYAFMQRSAERTGAFFGVPTRQVVAVGTEIEI